MQQMLVNRAAKCSLLFIGFSIPISTTLVNVGFGFLLLCFLLSGEYREKWRIISQHPLTLPILLLFFLLGIGVLYSTANSHDAVNLWMKYRKLLGFILLIPFLQSPQWRRGALIAFLASMLITLCFSYGGVIRKIILNLPLENATVFKTHIAQNFLMAFTTYILLQVSLLKNLRPLWRWLALLGALLAIGNILFFVHGRVGYIVLAMLLMLIIWQQFSFRGFMFGTGILVLLFSAVFLFSSTFQYRVLHTFDEVERYNSTQELTSAGTRLAFYKKSLSLIKESPLIGKGTGSLSNITVSHLKMPNPHNEYLMLTVQLGIIGLSVFLYLLFLLWKYSRQLPLFERRIAQGMIIAFATGCLFNSMLLDFTEGYWFIYFIAVLYAQISKTIPTSHLSKH